VKIAAARADGFVRAPDPAMRAVLVYGPDGGLARERADRLAGTVVPDLRDPFRVAELNPAMLKDDPARLADEAAALALTGGRRVVLLREAGDGITAILERFLAAPVGDALVVVEAGELGPRSSLRKLFEGAANAAALACYADDGASIAGVIREELNAAGLSADPDATAYLVAHLGSDRRLTRAELAKLILYMGAAGGRIGLAEASACIGDGAALSLDDLALAVADGDQNGVQRLLDRLTGAQPITILRAVARHFQRLHLAAGMVAQGRSVDQAVGALKPPVIFKVADRVKRQVGRWPLDRLGRALDMLIEAEVDCKTTGMPTQSITARALMQVARAAGSGSARRPS
jgi:DNA polymerase-3 subunit delta